MRNLGWSGRVVLALLLTFGTWIPQRVARAQDVRRDPEVIEAEAEPDDPANVGDPMEEDVEAEGQAAVNEAAGEEANGDVDGVRGAKAADDDDVVIVGEATSPRFQ